MSTSAIRAVIFANDPVKMTAFYRDALGLSWAAGDSEHVVLTCGNFDLIIHQESRRDFDAIKTPARRDGAALRLDFTVTDVVIARQKAAQLGGRVDDAPPSWAPPGARIHLGHDPEGNVFLVKE